MKKPEMIVVRFSGNDVIATSAKILTLSGMGDTDTKNNMYVFGNYSYTSPTGTNMTNMTNDMTSYFGDTITSRTSVDNGTNVSNINGLTTGGAGGTAGFNGNYVWNGNKFIKQ